MMSACQHRDDGAGCGIHIVLRVSDRAQRSWGSSGIRTHGCSPSLGGQKNGLRDLWSGAARVVRPQVAPRPRPRLRRSAHLPRVRGPAGSLPAVRRGEARGARLPGRQSVLHQALRLLRDKAAANVKRGSASRRRPACSEIRCQPPSRRRRTLRTRCASSRSASPAADASSLWPTRNGTIPFVSSARGERPGANGTAMNKAS